MTSHIRIQKPLGDRNLSRLTSPQVKYERAAQEIQKVKYPVQAIMPAKQLNVKINSFQSVELKKDLQEKLKDFISYRQVRGDGNCFIRAIAFHYLCSLKTSSFKKGFPEINDIKLTSCSQSSIPSHFKPFYEHNLLLNVLKSNWQIHIEKLKKQLNNNYKRIFTKMLIEYPYIDFIIILYFRAVVSKALGAYQKELIDFLSGTEEKDILKYSEESEGIIIDICSRYFKIEIQVYEVRSKEVMIYKYDPQTITSQSKIVDKKERLNSVTNKSQKKEKTPIIQSQIYSVTKSNEENIKKMRSQIKVAQNIDSNSKISEGENSAKSKSSIKGSEIVHLLFYENHYDIIQKKTDVAQEKTDKQKTEEDYYSIVNNNKIQGKCYECLKDTKVFEDTGLCEICHEISKTSLFQFKKEKQTQGKCMDCHEIRKDISEALGICQKCIEWQNKLQKQRQNEGLNKEKKSRKEATHLCPKCNLTLNSGHCSNCNKYYQQANNSLKKLSQEKVVRKIDRCVDCYRTELVSIELGLCKSCQQKQERFGERIMEDYKESIMCANCHKKYKKSEGFCKQCRQYRFINQKSLCSVCSTKEGIRDFKKEKKVCDLCHQIIQVDGPNAHNCRLKQEKCKNYANHDHHEKCQECKSNTNIRQSRLTTECKRCKNIYPLGDSHECLSHKCCKKCNQQGNLNNEGFCFYCQQKIGREAKDQQNHEKKKEHNIHKNDEKDENKHFKKCLYCQRTLESNENTKDFVCTTCKNNPQLGKSTTVPTKCFYCQNKIISKNSSNSEIQRCDECQKKQLKVPSSKQDKLNPFMGEKEKYKANIKCQQCERLYRREDLSKNRCRECVEQERKESQRDRCYQCQSKTSLYSTQLCKQSICKNCYHRLKAEASKLMEKEKVSLMCYKCKKFKEKNEQNKAPRRNSNYL